MAEFINLDAAYDSDTLTDWYISSVGSEPPVWTDEHIEELLNDFYVIPKDTPTIKTKPIRYGHWIWNKDHWEYSACGGNRFHDLSLSIDASYCGCCGAKMNETS